MDQIQSANPDIVRCLIWVAILTLMCSRRILRLIRNANPENANRYTHLRWAKVFTEQADRLLTEVLECMGLKLDMLTIYDIYLGQGCDPNVERERLMERWGAKPITHGEKSNEILKRWLETPVEVEETDALRDPDLVI